MTDYELTFITAHLLEQHEDFLLDNFDCITGLDHAGRSFVTITAPGRDAVEAAKAMHIRLMQGGITVQSLEFDLVSRGEIAKRLALTPQAVGNYIRGDRKATDDDFPSVFSDAAGGVWMWADVIEWARAVGVGTDRAPTLRYPRRADVEEFNACLRRDYDVDYSRRQTTDLTFTTQGMGIRMMSTWREVVSQVTEDSARFSVGHLIKGPETPMIFGLDLRNVEIYDDGRHEDVDV
ncbi:MAG: hypothetical protein P1U38_03655 [Aeromicrobium sp.]|uniref:hypothetical protein n=1 Tax=Aeromicrobium sp. TaxID=1871063 RepID=UPI002621400E|nr:hypothetical protein [Aeromicrobium sp.]MDF1703845.1 hypothetical protein [Aeromicrobium sp.]